MFSKNRILLRWGLWVFLPHLWYFQVAKMSRFLAPSLSAFVALAILGGINMEFIRRLRLIGACFRLAGGFGLIAGVKYALGFLSLDENGPESSVFPVGGPDA